MALFNKIHKTERPEPPRRGLIVSVEKNVRRRVKKDCERGPFLIPIETSQQKNHSIVMPYFDEPGVRFDDPLIRYDDPRTLAQILAELNPQPPHAMFEVVLEIDELSIPDLISRCHEIGNGTASHPDFASLASLVSQLGNQTTALTTRQTTIATTEASIKEQYHLRDTLDVPPLKGTLKELAIEIGKNATSEGAVAATTLRVKEKPGPKPVPDKPTGLELAFGDEAGELSGQCNGQPGVVDYYEIRFTTTDPNAPGTVWTLHSTSKKSIFDVRNLPSGQLVWISIRAINSRGESVWSDPASKRVP
jgi:hypothetical protein